MLKLAGQIIDVQDDGPLSLLRRGLSDEQIREKYASGEVLSSTESDALEDAAFAAIFCKESSLQRRAYPLGTPGQTLMSVAYFDKVASSEISPFPSEVRNQIACNLVAHADLFAVPVTDEMRKWASQHGEFLPNDNWIDVSMFESPEHGLPTEWAFRKSAADGSEMCLYPCSSKEFVAASLWEFEKTCGENYGLDPFQSSITASALIKKAEEYKIEIPESVRSLGTVEKRAAAEIHGLMLDRMERIPLALLDRGSNREKLAQAIQGIEAEQDPIKQAGAIAAFDAAVGFGAGHYETGLIHPYQVVFESGVKQAEHKTHLEKIGEDRIREYLGDDAVEEFKKNAQAAFDALKPEVQEALLAHV